MHKSSAVRLFPILAVGSAGLSGYLVPGFPLGALAAALVALACMLVLLARPAPDSRTSMVDNDLGRPAPSAQPEIAGAAMAAQREELSAALASAEKLQGHTISLSRSIRRGLARAPFLRALLRLVTDKSEAAVFDLMERFMAVSGELGSVLSRAEGVRSQVVGSGEGSAAAVVAEARAASSAGEALLRTFLDGSRDTAKSTERMRELVEGSMEMLRDIEDVSECSRLIAFNLAVEAARIGRQGQGIKVIVNELSSINDKIIAFSKSVAIRLKENRDLGVMIADRLGRETGTLAVNVEQGRAASERALERLIGTTRSVVELLDTMTTSFDSARQSMDGMLTSMQFQDITRQQVETVDWAVADMSNDLEAALAAVGYTESLDRKALEDFRRRLLEQAKVQDEKAMILEVKE